MKNCKNMIKTILVFTVLTYGVATSCVEASFYFGEAGEPKANEVHIGRTAVVMPLETILLVRRGNNMCAVKFTKFWTGKTDEDLYAEYESVGLTGNGKPIREELSFPKPRGIGRLAFSFGNKEIKCGPFKLFWSGKGAVHFHAEGQKQGDYGIELAPTSWSNISDVKIADPCLKWYRYDENRRRQNIPVDKLGRCF